MDYTMDYRPIYCLRNGLPLDMDVYDLAEWSAIALLSALSLSITQPLWRSRLPPPPLRLTLHVGISGICRMDTGTHLLSK